MKLNLQLARTSRTIAAISLAVASLALTAQAHFIWLHLPQQDEGGRLEVLFGDGIYEDSDARLVRYLDGLDLWAEGGRALELEGHDWGFDLDTTEALDLVGATKPMGVFTPRDGGENRLLEYYAKGAATLADARRSAGLHTEVFAWAEGEELVLELRFGDQPAAGGELTIWPLGTHEEQTFTADDAGRTRVPNPRDGSFAIRGRVIVPEAGEQDGKSYTTKQHYSTLVIATLRSEALLEGSSVDAYQRALHASRCSQLPLGTQQVGGTLRVNVDGTSYRGEFDLEEDGFSLLLREAPPEVLAQLTPLVEGMFTGLRPNPLEPLLTRYPLALASRDGHPLGRRISLADPAQTTFRVDVDRLQSVTRLVEGMRITRQVLEYTETESGHYAPAHILVLHADAETGALLRSEAISDTYEDFAGLRLPRTRRVSSWSRGEASIVEVRLLTMEVL